MKNTRALLLTALAMACIPFSSAHASDPENSKLVLTYTPAGETTSSDWDCKISLKEITYTNGKAGHRYVCIYFSTDNSSDEATPATIFAALNASKAGQGSFSAGYTGTDSQSLMKLLNKWESYLVYGNGEKPEAAAWNASLVSRSGDVTIVRYVNSETNATFDVSVKMGYVIPENQATKKAAAQQ